MRTDITARNYGSNLSTNSISARLTRLAGSRRTSNIAQWPVATACDCYCCCCCLC